MRVLTGKGRTRRSLPWPARVRREGENITAARVRRKGENITAGCVSDARGKISVQGRDVRKKG